MKVSTIEALSPYQFMKVMTHEDLRHELAHQLLQQHKPQGMTEEEMERTEKYLRYVLKFATKDQYIKYLSGFYTLD